MAEGKLRHFDLQPRLIGDLVELRPLQPVDFAALFAVASDPLIWTGHPARDRYKEDVFRDFFAEALASGGALLVLDRTSDAVIGTSRYVGADLDRGQVEIGWTFLARSHWGGRYNRDMKRLMIDHAFRFVNRVVFLVGADNRRSRVALERIGARWTGAGSARPLNGVVVQHVEYEINRPVS